MILSLPAKHVIHRALKSLWQAGACHSMMPCVFVLVFSVTLSLHARAQGDMQFSGFATLGLSSENKDDLGFLRDSNQSKDPNRDTTFSSDSIIGAQLSSSFAESWRVTTQLVYRDRPRYKLDDAVELAFVAYRPFAGMDLRLGRVAVDMFQLSDFRRVDYANLWVRPPTEVYAWILPSSIDGADAAYSFTKGVGFWRFKLQYGNTDPLLELPNGSSFIEVKFEDFIVGTATLDFDMWRFRLSYSQATPEVASLGFADVFNQVAASVPGSIGEEAQLLADRLTKSSGRAVQYTQASLGFDDGNWLFDTEFTHITTDGAIIPTGLAGYASLGHRFDEITPYITYSRFLSDQDLYVSDVDWSVTEALQALQPLRDEVIGAFNGVQLEQHTHTLGLRWDVAPRTAIKAQWDNTHITKGKFAIWAHDNGRSLNNTTVDLFSFALNIVF